MTLPTDVATFVDSIENKRRRADTDTMLAMMERVTGLPPAMWGPTMIGYDSYHYKYDSGREGDSFVAGFSPRKAHIVVYITNGFGAYGDLLAQLGKFKSSVSCLYINKLADVDEAVLEDLIARSYADMTAKYA